MKIIANDRTRSHLRTEYPGLPAFGSFVDFELIDETLRAIVVPLLQFPAVRFIKRLIVHLLRLSTLVPFPS